MEALFGEGKVRKMDVETIYEALFLRSVASFELFLEKLFVSIMLGKKVNGTSLMSAASKGALQAILLQNNDYLDWLPYTKTESRAAIYLRNGRPFTNLSDGDRSQIKTITIIRNAIAHKSDYAIGEFKNKVIGEQPLLRNERQPAGFLRSQVRANPRQLRFEVYESQLARIASSLC